MSTQALDTFVEREKDEASFALKVFYGRNNIREIADRLRMMVVGGESRYNQAQAVTLAQGALLHGLSPFNGEIYLLTKKDGSSIGLMVGIKGLRKHAHRQVRRMRTQYHVRIVEVTDPDERAQYLTSNQYSQNTHCYKAILTVDSKVGQWIVNYQKLSGTGLNKDEVFDILGPKPETIGIGIFDTALEKYIWSRGKLSPSQYAMKRAEAAALKMEFDVLYAMEYSEQVDEMFGADVSNLGQNWDNDGVPVVELPEYPVARDEKPDDGLSVEERGKKALSAMGFKPNEKD